MKKFILLFFIPLSLFAQTPEEIEEQLDDAEAEFKKAKEMFNPWYAGPLLTGGAHMMPPGYMGIQPYVFVTDNYARFNSHRHSVNTPDLIQLNPQMAPIQAGITSWLDAALVLQGEANWQSGQSGGGFGDMNLTLGFRLLEEGLYVPAMKIGIGETFPTGRYQRLSSTKNGLDATGAGSYQTALSFRIAKLFLWATEHPLNLRATATYTLPSSVDVRGFNAYGGGFGTRGKVKPGRQFNASVGMEWSFTQKWVFANDFVYVTSSRTKFSGTPGTTAAGAIAAVGASSSDQFSLCPAIEYNPTADLNFIGGVWFSLTGRNSSNFISGILSVSYTFKVH